MTNLVQLWTIVQVCCGQAHQAMNWVIAPWAATMVECLSAKTSMACLPGLC